MRCLQAFARWRVLVQRFQVDGATVQSSALVSEFGSGRTQGSSSPSVGQHLRSLRTVRRRAYWNSRALVQTSRGSAVWLTDASRSIRNAHLVAVAPVYFPPSNAIDGLVYFTNHFFAKPSSMHVRTIALQVTKTTVYGVECLLLPLRQSGLHTEKYLPPPITIHPCARPRPHHRL